VCSFAPPFSFAFGGGGFHEPRDLLCWHPFSSAENPSDIFFPTVSLPLPLCKHLTHHRCNLTYDCSQPSFFGFFFSVCLTRFTYRVQVCVFFLITPVFILKHRRWTPVRSPSPHLFSLRGFSQNPSVASIRNIPRLAVAVSRYPARISPQSRALLQSTPFNLPCTTHLYFLPALFWEMTVSLSWTLPRLITPNMKGVTTTAELFYLIPIKHCPVFCLLVSAPVGNLVGFFVKLAHHHFCSLFPFLFHPRFTGVSPLLFSLHLKEATGCRGTPLWAPPSKLCGSIHCSPRSLNFGTLSRLFLVRFGLELSKCLKPSSWSLLCG